MPERKKQESDNARKRKRDAVVTNLKELEAKKMIALEKVEKKLKTYYEFVLIKAAEDAKNAHTYAIEEKIIMEEQHNKLTETNKLEDNT